MKLPPNDRYFSTESSAEDYDREMAAADSAIYVGTFIQLVRGRCETHWHKAKPHQIEVGAGIYQAMQVRIRHGLFDDADHSLCMDGDKITICGIPIVQKPE